MQVTLLDTETGKTKVISDPELSYWYWSEGNGSCDCNRAMFLGIDKEIGETAKPGCCYGSTRVLVVDVTGYIEGATRMEALRDFNSDYPDDLIEKHIPH